MATSRLADRRIREAASQAALRLDVRGPVSEALGRAGVVVPPAAPEAAPPASASPRPPGRRRARGLAPTVKPFKAAPWPTGRATDAAPAPLSGLTADERRVHRILIDTLDMATEQASGLGGLAFGERKRLEALDLAFIDAELAGNALHDALRGRMRQTLSIVGLIAGIVIVLAVAIVGDGVVAAGIAAGVLALVVSVARSGPATGQRRRILRALRELAVLAHADDAASEAMLQADALIDTLADADLGRARSETPGPARRARS